VRGRVSDIYDHIKLPNSGANNTEKLCIEKPCFYWICENNGDCNESALKSIILTNFVPNMCQKIPITSFC
jgi:hypothetical protein